MGTRLYIGNLSYSTTAESLRAAFEQDGRQVKDATVIMDKMTGQSRGFGFVEMVTDADAEAAIAAMDGRDLDGRALRVSEARERTPGGGGGGGGGFRGPRPGGAPGGGPGGGGRPFRGPPREPEVFNRDGGDFRRPPFGDDRGGGPPGDDRGGGRRERDRKRGKRKDRFDRDEHDDF